jgi:lipopolysaccharide biosynthesis glycosyltransferase
MTNPLHVVFAANRAYIPYVSAAITSVRHNLDPTVALHVTILSGDIVPTEIGWPNKGSADSLRCFSPDVDASTLPIRPSDYLTVETYYRLFLEKAFDEAVKRIVYLDADLVAVGDLSPLKDIDLKGKTIAAVRDYGTTEVRGHFDLLGISSSLSPAPYFNAGVLVIDMGRWRDSRVCDQCLTFLRANQALVRFHDQDALNYVLAGEWMELDESWNRMSPSWQAACRRNRELGTPIDPGMLNPRIVHFAWPNKPWNGFRHPDRRVFDTYVTMAGFGGHRMTLLKAVKQKAWSVLRRAVFSLHRPR